MNAPVKSTEAPQHSAVHAPTATAAPAAERAELHEVHSEFLSTQALMLSDKNMARMLDFAKVMATGKVTVPEELRNPGDCLAITMQALQWRMNPFAVAQKTHIIKGKLGYEAQLVNAVINSMAPTKDRIHFEWYGPWDKILGRFEMKKGERGEYRVPAWKLDDEKGIGVKVWATLKGENEPRVLELLLSQAATRNSTLWAEDPRQQLAYLGVKRWSRLYCPDVILGVYTTDEVAQFVEEKDIGSGTTTETQGQDKPQPYTDTEFNGLLEKWGRYVAEGKKTPDEIIATVASKRPITDGQKEAIRGLKKAVDGAPTVTYAIIKDKLETATQVDLLDAHADLIGEVADAEQRKELGAFYKQRRDELSK